VCPRKLKEIVDAKKGQLLFRQQIRYFFSYIPYHRSYVLSKYCPFFLLPHQPPPPPPAIQVPVYILPANLVLIPLAIQGVGFVRLSLQLSSLLTSLSVVPQAAEAMTRQFLSPCLFGCRDSERLREAVLTAVSELAQALKRMRDADAAAAGGGDGGGSGGGGGGGGDAFVMSQHEELLHSAIAVLQEWTPTCGSVFVLHVTRPLICS
jgi:hypothetical protein